MLKKLEDGGGGTKQGRVRISWHNFKHPLSINHLGVQSVALASNI